MRSVTRDSLFGNETFPGPEYEHRRGLQGKLGHMPGPATCERRHPERPDARRNPTRLAGLYTVDCAGNSANGMPLTQTQKMLWRQVAKVAATNLGMRIRSLPVSPSNPVHLAWGQHRPSPEHVGQRHPDHRDDGPDQTIQTQNENSTVQHQRAWAGLGAPNPICIPHIGVKLVRTAPEEGEDDARGPA
jgi:hypothetical protein